MKENKRIGEFEEIDEFEASLYHGWAVHRVFPIWGRGSGGFSCFMFSMLNLLSMSNDYRTLACRIEGYLSFLKFATFTLNAKV